MPLVGDGNRDFSGGQNSSLLPRNIGQNQYARGINVTTVDGGLRPRPGWQRVKFDIEGDASLFLKGKFQGATVFDNSIIATVSGVLWSVNPCTGKVVQLTKEAQLSKRLRQIQTLDIGDRLVAFNPPSFPSVLERGRLRDIDPSKFEMPIVATLGTYNHNRAFVAGITNSFTGGDPTGSIFAAIDPPLTFAEISLQGAEFFNQVFTAGVTPGSDTITAMGFLQMADTTVGIGPLFISTERAIYSYRTDLPRSQWLQTQFSKLLVYNNGMDNQRAWDHANSDIMYVGVDGKLYTLAVKSEEQRGRWSNSSISAEVKNWLKRRKNGLEGTARVRVHDDRVFVSAMPYRVVTGDGLIDYAHQGSVVLELENREGTNENPIPVWAGLWTGINPMEYCSVGGDLYIFSKDEPNFNRLYKMVEGGADLYDDYQPIRSRIYTREYTYEDPFQQKEESTAMVEASGIKGDFRLVLDRKPKHAESWKRWGVVEGKRTSRGVASTAFSNIAGPSNDNDCAGGNLYSSFFSNQYRMTIEGFSWVIEGIIAKANTVGDSTDSDSCKPLEYEIMESEIDDIGLTDGFD